MNIAGNLLKVNTLYIYHCEAIIKFAALFAVRPYSPNGPTGVGPLGEYAFTGFTLGE
jgi:hypothetical protein